MGSFNLEAVEPCEGILIVNPSTELDLGTLSMELKIDGYNRYRHLTYLHLRTWGFEIFVDRHGSSQ